MHRIALLVAAFALAACSTRSPWAGGSAKVPVATPESEKPAVAAPVAPGETVASAAHAEGSATAAAAPADAAAPATPAPHKYSWQAPKKDGSGDAGSTKVVLSGPPNDETKARILAVRLDQGMVAFIRKEKPDDGAFLQLTKNDKALLVRVNSSDDKMTVADIVIGQSPSKIPALEVGEEVICGLPSDLPPQ